LVQVKDKTLEEQRILGNEINSYTCHVALFLHFTLSSKRLWSCCQAKTVHKVLHGF